jgi:hypothetical protein
VHPRKTQEFFLQGDQCQDQGGTDYFWETGYSGPGRGYCEFDKVEEKTFDEGDAEEAADVYEVHANCKGQSGIEATWAELFELRLSEGTILLTYLPES